MDRPFNTQGRAYAGQRRVQDSELLEDAAYVEGVPALRDEPEGRRGTGSQEPSGRMSGMKAEFERDWGELKAMLMLTAVKELKVEAEHHIETIDEGSRQRVNEVIEVAPAESCEGPIAAAPSARPALSEPDVRQPFTRHELHVRTVRVGTLEMKVNSWWTPFDASDSFTWQEAVDGSLEGAIEGAEIPPYDPNDSEDSGEDAHDAYCKGVIRLGVTFDVCVKEFIHFVQELQNNRRLRFLRLVGNKCGAEIWLGLRDALTLGMLLREIEDVPIEGRPVAQVVDGDKGFISVHITRLPDAA